MIGLVIPVYQRPKYLFQTVESLLKSDLSDVRVLVIDDGNDQEMHEALTYAGSHFELLRKNHSGVALTLQYGFDILKQCCNVLVNLDADMIVSPNWIKTMYDLHKKFDGTIVTGFNSCDSTPHAYFPDQGYCLKNTGVGGANLMFSKYFYHRVVRRHYIYGPGWDWRLIKTLRISGRDVVVTMPSVVQHIGLNSTMHRHEIFPKAVDYVY